MLMVVFKKGGIVLEWARRVARSLLVEIKTRI